MNYTNLKLTKLIFYSVIFILFFSFFSPVKINNVIGATIKVPADYPTIQAAINAAQSGGTIEVSSGTYPENIIITKNLTLTGDNRDTTIIDGGKNGHVIYAHSDTYYLEVNISGFTIRNAKDSFSCIYFNYVNQGNITGTRLTNTEQSYGILLNHCSEITIANNQILNNPSAGIGITFSTQNKIYENTFQSNLIGIQFSMSSNYNTLYNNTFMGNTLYQAKDPCNNYWDYNGRGNYWDDYTGVDVNPKDGIGDTPYNIPGGSNQDHYPLGYFKSTESTPPEAYIISITPNPATFGQLVSFSGYGYDPDGGYIIGYKWRSSDQTLSTEASFTTSSLSVGTHSIYFSVQDDEGDWSTEKMIVLTITEPLQHIKPIAVIDSVIPTQTTYGEQVSFIGHGIDTYGSITAYKWASSLIGVLSDHSSFNRSDLPVGTHNISFQVMDISGEWSDPASSKLIIFPTSSSSTNKPPIAHADGPSIGIVNTSLNFTGTNSYDLDGTIINYHWDFGDEQTGAGISVTHTYTQIGNYTVVLKVTDNNGSQTTDSFKVTVTSTRGQTNHDNGDGGSLLDWFNQIPIVIIAPVLGILIFVAVITIFFHRMEHS